MKKTIALSLAAALTLSLLSGCTAKPAPSAAPAPTASVTTGTLNYADTIAWDGQYDVVVAGFGGAGAVAAKTAADAGAKVLLVEKAPEGEEGGNTRFCGQLFAYGNNDYDATLAYYKTLPGDREVPEAMLEVYAKGISTMADTIVNDFGANKDTLKDWTGDTRIGPMSPEYPEFPGADKIGLWTLHDGISDAYMWQLLRKNVTDRADKIDVWFESPAVGLIQDPQSKTIVGMQVEREGKTLNIRATNGVILATGGFENNLEMVETYLGMAHAATIGGLYNTGDGIRMAAEVGADPWHMSVFEGISILGGMSFMVPDGARAVRAGSFSLCSGSSMLLAADGSRYLREDESTRHGHIYQGGIWDNVKRPLRSFVFFDQAQADAIAEAKGIPESHIAQIIKADTLEDLAKQTGMNAEILANTVKNFNGYAATGVDLQFGREAKNMKAVSATGPYYAIEMMPAILNTQGGPRRNENAEMLDTDGKPIPHLYSAGEMGGITALQYQGGGNIAECFIFGALAGNNAAAPKGDLPAYTLPAKTDSVLKYTPGSVTDITPAFDESTLKPGQYLGTGTGMGGPLQVVVTMDGDKISKVEVVTQKETEGIGDKAISAIPGAIVAANSADVDAVATATVTSKAIIEAVKDAMSKIK